MTKRVALKLAIVMALALPSAIAPPAAADYIPTSYDQLLEVADLIAIGTVRSVGDKTFDLELERVFVARREAAGLATGDHIDVVKFRRRMCVPRWILEYAPGQRSLFFIARWPGEGWWVPGAGNEGLMPIVGEFVFVSSDVARVSGEWTVHGVTIEGDRLPLAPVLEILERNKPPPTAAVVVTWPDTGAEATSGSEVWIEVDRKQGVESMTRTSRDRWETFQIWRGWKNVRIAGGDRLIIDVRPGKYRLRAMSRACSRRSCPAVEVDAALGPPVNLTAATNGRQVELRLRDLRL